MASLSFVSLFLLLMVLLSKLVVCWTEGKHVLEEEEEEQCLCDLQGPQSLEPATRCPKMDASWTRTSTFSSWPHIFKNFKYQFENLHLNLFAMILRFERTCDASVPLCSKCPRAPLWKKRACQEKQKTSCCSSTYQATLYEKFGHWKFR